MNSPRYVLVTSAYNEEQYISLTIESVLAQAQLPLRWVIVSDGSTDRTDEIVERYSKFASFIELLRLTEVHSRNFAAQARAISAGVECLAHLDYDFIGNLDADITFGPRYFQTILERLVLRPELGLAGGTVREIDGRLRSGLHGERLRAVAHAVQLFRRRCFEEVGGYPALPFGGPDTYAEVAARMHGWEVECFEDVVVQHLRPAASAGGILRGRFRQGLMDWSLGYSPAFEFFRCMRRLTEPPRGIGSLVRAGGFMYAGIFVRRRAVPEKFVRFLRVEQCGRLRAFIFGAPSPLR